MLEFIFSHNIVSLIIGIIGSIALVIVFLKDIKNKITVNQFYLYYSIIMGIDFIYWILRSIYHGL